jgi:hypothetical protein
VRHRLRQAKRQPLGRHYESEGNISSQHDYRSSGTSLSYAISLLEILKNRNSNLYEKSREIEHDAQGLLTYTAAAFPYYTPHDFTHSSNVIEVMNWIIPDSVKPTLNDHEIFFLIVAGWLHDWGMVCEQGESPEGVRAIHHVRTEEKFLALHDKLGLDLHEAEIIGRIARGHRVEDLNSSLFDEQVFSSNIHVDIRFLSAVLRIADECDISYNRVPELIYYSLNPKEASAEHFKEHLDIGGVGKSGDHKIVFNATAFDPKGAQTLKELAAKMQRELDHVKAILAVRNIRLEYVEPTIYARGFVNEPIAFRLDEASITQLLIGEALYSRKDVAVRELLQNSVDACRARGKIPTHVRIYIENDKLVVEDNGIGMDFRRAYDFLARKGLSYYMSKEFKETKHEVEFDPISRWGLGILSCFLIASDVHIETMMAGKEPCRFLIRNVGEGWRYEKGSLKEPGTIVTLSLNATGKSLQLEQVVRYYVKSCVVPIYLGKDTREHMKFDWSIQDPTVQRALVDERFKGTVRSEYKREDNDVEVRFYETTDYSGLIFIANQGFFVENAEHLDYFPRPPRMVCLINTKRELFDVEVSRDRLRTSGPRFSSFRDKWIGILKKCMLEELERRPTHTDVEETIRYYELLGKYDLNLSSTVVEVLSELPASIENILVCETPFLVLSKDGVRKLTLKDVGNSKPSKLIMYRYGGYFVSEMQSEVDFAYSNSGSVVDRNDLLLFFFRTSMPTFGELGLLEAFLRKACQVGEISNLNLIGMLRAMQFPKHESPLSMLLPQSSFLSRLSSCLRSAAICMEPFGIAGGNKLAGRFRESYAGRGSIAGYPEDDFDADGPKTILAHLVRKFLGLEAHTDGIEVVKTPGFIFDLDDDFIQILLANDVRIRENPAIERTVRDYFVQLAACYVCSARQSLDLLNLKEQEICSYLAKPNPSLIQFRLGQLSKVLLKGGSEKTYSPPSREFAYFRVEEERLDESDDELFT